MQHITNSLLISYLTLRKAIGWLGVLLPFILWFVNFVIYNLGYFGLPENALKPSISHYYYTPVSELFTGTLCAVSFFLFAYKGYDTPTKYKFLTDNFLCNLAAICAIGVALFPTSSSEAISDNSRSFISNQTIGYLHFTFAGLFFLSLSILSLVNFRLTSRTENRKLYTFCGYGMLLCLVLIFLYNMFLQEQFPALVQFKPVFWLETIALVLFGMSWLMKGRVDFYFILKMIGMKSS
jgi:Protein of unknown function (DUF998)